MKILMVNLVNFAEFDGGSTHQLALLKNWQLDGNEVRMIAPFRRSGDGTGPMEIEGVTYSPSLRTLGLPLVFDALVQLPLIASHRFVHDFSVLYVRANLLTFLQVALARMLGMKVVVEHNCWCSTERRMRGGRGWVVELERRVQVLSAKWAQMSRSVTSGIAEKLSENGVSTRRVLVIGNGTSIGRFRPVPRAEALQRQGLSEKPVWLGFIGVLAAWQGVDTALRAFALLPQRLNVRLIIAGDGPARRGLMELAGELHIVNRVHFMGHVPYDRANEVINCFDIALAPFTQERNNEIGLSALKIRDYAAAGRLVVASDIKGVRELANHKWLYLHRPDDAQNLADCVAMLLSRPDLRAIARERARAYAKEHFDWSAIAKRIIDSIKAI